MFADVDFVERHRPGIAIRLGLEVDPVPHRGDDIVHRLLLPVSEVARSAMTPLEYLERGGLDPLAQNRMQAASGHDIRFVSEDSSGGLLHLHQLEKPERPHRMIKEKINI